MFKKVSLFIAGAALLVGISACNSNPSYKEVKNLETNKQKYSYSIGVNIGTNFKAQELDIDFDSFMKGLSDAINGGDTLLTPEEMNQVLQELQKETMAKMQAKMNAEAYKNAEEGKKFLEENKAKEGVKVTESGLQYKVLKEGNGPKAKASDKVKAHYTGKLLDGTVFDSSVERNQPFETKVTDVIKGWQEALQLMNVGAKYEIYVPAELAYGERGAGQVIAPNATLIFEMELLEIVK